jgi:hypothetical protein
VPIPGTRRIPYLEENVATAEIALTESELAELSEAAPVGAATGDRYPAGADVDAHAGIRAPKLLDRRTISWLNNQQLKRTRGPLWSPAAEPPSVVLLLWP